jgi:hypothetical protein
LEKIVQKIGNKLQKCMPKEVQIKIYASKSQGSHFRMHDQIKTHADGGSAETNVGKNLVTCMREFVVKSSRVSNQIG